VTRVKGAAVIPVWLTECEEHEMPRGQRCDGVPCFSGTCWYEWTRQLMPVAREAGLLAALLPYRALGNDDRRYGDEAAWVATALRSFAEMPPKRGGEPLPASRLIAVLQGWDVSAARRRAQLRQAESAGAAGSLLALTPIDQSWEPRFFRMGRTAGGAAAEGAAAAGGRAIRSGPRRAGRG